MNKKISPKVISLVFGVLVICFAIAFYAVGWTEPQQTPPDCTSGQPGCDAPINVSLTAQIKQGNLGVNALGISATGNALLVPNGNVGIGTEPSQKLDVAGYVKGRSGLCMGNNCREAWPDAPLSNLNKFVAGHEYYSEGTEPYLRDATYPYPYLTLENAVNNFGIDPNDPKATNWFPIGYSYWQPYTQYRSSLFIDEGDNSFCRNLYLKESPNFDRNNPNDPLVFGYYADTNGVRQVTGDESFIDQCIANQGYQNCVSVTGKRYADSTSNLKGRVILQIRLKSWWQPENCYGHDYLPGMSLGSWGDPKVSNFKINPYQNPDITGDICYWANIHSQIEARFVNMNYEPYCGEPDPIQNFYNANLNFTYMIKSIGIAYLTWIQ